MAASAAPISTRRRVRRRSACSGPSRLEGAVAVAEEQTEGRGRLGRTWVSPPGVSILCSVLLEPAVETPRLPELTIVAGEACAEAIGRVTGLEPRIKLPNDVLLGDRKVAGILAEARDGRVVLGVGINVNVEPAELPQDMPKPATSLLGELGEPSTGPSSSSHSSSRSSSTTTAG